MLFDSAILNAIVDTLNPLKIIANIRNAISPVVTFVDGLLGYEDFILCYDGKPEKANIQPKMVYFYKENNKLYCITKSTENEIELSSDDLGPDVFKEMMVTLDDSTKKARLTTPALSTLYNFLKLNKVEVGIKSTLHKKVVERYNKFETNFIAKNPKIHKAYLYCKQGINDLCTFAASQTGLRIAGLISATAIAIASGGMMPAIMAGAYAASIGISTIQQTYSKVSLNRLTQEAELLIRYKANNKALGRERTFHKSKPPEQAPKGAIRKWLSASAKHLSTYFFEAAVPLAAAVLSPVNGVISGVQFGVFVGLSSVGVGVGAYFRKLHEDQKEALKTEIDKTRRQNDIPDYNNIIGLQRMIIIQEKTLKKQGVDEDLSLQKRSKLYEYSKAFRDVINPFSDYQEVKDSKIFARTVAGVAVSMTAAAAFGSGVPEIAAVGLSTAVAATAGLTTVVKNSYAKKQITSDKEIVKTRSKEQEITKEKPITQIITKETPNTNLRSDLLKKKPPTSYKELVRESRAPHPLETGRH